MNMTPDRFERHHPFNRPPPPGSERPWEWSEPRGQDLGSAEGFTLDDGRPLDEVLDRLQPRVGRLEGSLLGWIVNPVICPRGLRAWVDFTGGRRVVIEDRFAARSHFEFRALELPRAVDLLYFLRSRETERGAVRSLTELAADALAGHAELPPPLALGPSGRGPFAGLQELKRVWRFQTGLERVRAERRRRWPDTFAELERWIGACLGEELAPADEDQLLSALRDLARRRFSGG